MALFKGRSSLLEVQNRALIKTARERAAQIEKLERELQALQEGAAQIEKLGPELRHLQQTKRELQALQQSTERQAKEIERLTLERNFYFERASALEEQNRELTDSATKYSLQAQKLERELTDVATQYSVRAQKLERELTEVATEHALRAQNLERELTQAATKYSQWGQKLERELARIDPDGAPARRFEAQPES